MDLSKFLSRVMAIYFLFMGLILCVDKDPFLHSLNLVINDEPLMFVSGFFTLILGSMMIVSHSIWRLNWQGAVTLLSWLFFLKGVCLILYPHILYGMTTVFVQTELYVYIAASLDVALGLLLAYFGFRKEA
jgi:hypothetical protein